MPACPSWAEPKQRVVVKPDLTVVELNAEQVSLLEIARPAAVLAAVHQALQLPLEAWVRAVRGPCASVLVPHHVIPY